MFLYRYVFPYILLFSLISTNKQVKSNNVINRNRSGKIDSGSHLMYILGSDQRKARKKLERSESTSCVT